MQSPLTGRAVTAQITFRGPVAADAARIWKLVRQGGVLEENSPYCYLLLCTHFAGHGIVAERGGRLLGFVCAYRPPGDPAAVFVWQIGVAPEGRGRGLGTELLRRLIARPANREAKYLTATVAVDNEPSQRLFAALARSVGASLETEAGFGPELFPVRHPAEPLIRIGPLAPRD